jgi:hypothetical protein
MSSGFDEMRVQITRNLIADAAGRMIFCPDCKHALSMPNVVLLTGDTAGVSCGECFDAQLMTRSLTAQDLRDLGLEIDDGRELP